METLKDIINEMDIDARGRITVNKEWGRGYEEAIDKYLPKLKALSSIQGDGNVSEYQLCPKCNGEGIVTGFDYNSMTTSVTNQCGVCNGAKVLAKPILKSQSTESIQVDGYWKQRCEAAEDYLDSHFASNPIHLTKKRYDKWQQLKSQSTVKDGVNEVIDIAKQHYLVGEHILTETLLENIITFAYNKGKSHE